MPDFNVRLLWGQNPSLSDLVIHQRQIKDNVIATTPFSTYLNCFFLKMSKNQMKTYRADGLYLPIYKSESK
jgi:hypothetical protein